MQTEFPRSEIFPRCGMHKVSLMKMVSSKFVRACLYLLNKYSATILHFKLVALSGTNF